ncbi:Putative O-antigen ligase [Moritella sp. PE36]|uniref:O-antigen ligase family protein n=1 Tax=Moritella sp. PE36 TaxID=58051 RepID=UPI0001568A2A|nr:O-antigen ligase family protein [Moritella sp. PE36]EDM67629.1 Putative O-antigen ligase [Moritella sp. PE36]
MKEKLYNALILMPFIWAFSGLLLFRNGDKLMIVAILISITATLLHYGFDSIKQNLRDRGLWLIFTLTIYAVFSYYYHGSSSREMRALLGAMLLLLTFPRILLSKYHLKWLVALGSTVVLSSTYYLSEYLQIHRVDWPLNAIPHATIGAVIAIVTLVLLLDEKNNRNKMMLSLCFSLSIAALLINQTRGIWLSVVIAAILILFLKVKIKHINWRYTLITLVILSIGVYVAKPQIQQRIDKTSTEIVQIKSGDFTSSIGIRLELWMISPEVIAERPILGHGNGDQEKLNEIVARGGVYKRLVEFKHYHNQYIDRLVSGGIVSLILLLALLTYPLLFLLPGVNQQIGIGISIVYATAGLTDVPFNHGATLFMYLLLIFTLKTKSYGVNR